MNNIIVTILGKSGMGKSSSIRNLDPLTTAIISTDSKPLPFRGAGKFKVVEVTGEQPEVMFSVLERLQKNDAVKTVVVDAFSQFSEGLTFYFNRKFKGFDRKNHYNDSVFLFWDMLAKLKGKTVFVFAHPVIGETMEGTDTITAKVDNKMRKGIVEERSTVLLMARAIKGENGIEYVFETQTNGTTPTKSPLGMFETATIPNDLKLVNEAIEKYYE